MKTASIVYSVQTRTCCCIHITMCALQVMCWCVVVDSYVLNVNWSHAYLARIYYFRQEINCFQL